MFFAIIFLIAEYKYFMKLQILIDNRQDADGRLHYERGFSLYMEACGKRILIDTGLSGKAMDNAKTLGVDISKVDFLILSHGHKDHTGGLWRFVEENRRGAIVSCRKISELDYTSDSGGGRHSLNPDKDIIRSNKDRFVFLDRNLLEVRDGSNVISAGVCDVSSHPKPNGNRLLRANGNPYGGQDELAISVVEDGRMTIISPCTHSGIGNVEECCRKRTGMEATNFVGGLHFVDGEEDVHSGTFDGCNIQKIYTGHCTGRIAQDRLQDILGERLCVFRTGDVIYC